MSGRIDNDAVLHAALRQVNVELENEHVDLHGKMPAEVHADHAKARAEHFADTTVGKLVPKYEYFKAAVTGDFAGLAMDKAKAAALHVFEKKVGPIPPAVLVGVETIDAALKTIKEGKEIHESLVRVNGYLATAGLCMGALPDGFLAAKIFEVPAEYRPSANSARLPWPQGADRAHTALLGLPTEIQLAFKQACREGQCVALQGGARYPEDVDLLLRREDVRKRYEQDPAFRVGFDSARWALENKKADALRSNLGIINRSDSIIDYRG